MSRVTSSPALEAEVLPTTRARRTRYVLSVYKPDAICFLFTFRP
jgi:hypothetical protein